MKAITTKYIQINKQVTRGKEITKKIYFKLIEHLNCKATR